MYLIIQSKINILFDTFAFFPTSDKIQIPRLRSVKSISTKNAKSGAQIDLIIDRRDQTINIIEMKFSAAPVTITKSYAAKLQQKIDVFKEETKTRKAVHLTMITTYGLVKNEYSTMVRNSLKMDVLFKNLEE